MMLIVVLCITIALSGGFIIGVALGTVAERERARHRPEAPHEALARVYQMPAPADILAELRGPLGKGPA